MIWMLVQIFHCWHSSLLRLKKKSDENWVQAMDEEMDSIEKNETWDLVNLPNEKNLIGVKWV